MQRILTLLVLGVAAWLAGTTAHAEVVDFQISADDYAKLTIDGDQVALVDTLPGGTDDVSLDLAPGLHDIVVEYENRFGSSWLSLSWKDPADASYTIIPEANLFSQDAAGNVINGLLAEYSFSADFNDNGIVEGSDFLVWQRGFGTGTTKMDGDANGDGTVDLIDLSNWQNQYGRPNTIYGEGPIAHSHRNFYEGISGVPWGGFVSTWTLFGETLTGQLLVESSNAVEAVLGIGSVMGSAVPEPNSLVLIGIALALSAAGRSRIRKVREPRR